MKEDRYQKILDILSCDNYVSVEALSRALYVSLPTIRRDLSAMQDMGLVIRSHGGVIKRRSGQDDSPILFRTGVNAGEKLRLARAASQLLHNDCVVFMDESTTTLHVIDQIPNYKNITVVTNSVSVMNLLYKYRIHCHCLGGEFSVDTMSFYGSATEEMAERFGIDLMFFSCSAINHQGQIVDYCGPANSLRRKVVQLAQTKVFLCDKSKFCKRGEYVLMPLSQADYIVTNGKLPADYDIGNAKLITI